jgi:hypothetical protein
VTVSTQQGERGLCVFCTRLQRDISNHFATKHPGCGLRIADGACGEIRGMQGKASCCNRKSISIVLYVTGPSYALCERCYDRHGGPHLPRNQVSAPSASVAETALALPPLTMLGSDIPENSGSSQDDMASSYSFDGASSSCQADPYSAMRPYLGLKERRPYPQHVSFDQCDPLGSKVVDKVSENKRRGLL